MIFTTSKFSSFRDATQEKLKHCFNVPSIIAIEISIIVILIALISFVVIKKELRLHASIDHSLEQDDKQQMRTHMLNNSIF